MRALDLPGREEGGKWRSGRKTRGKWVRKAGGQLIPL